MPERDGASAPTADTSVRHGLLLQLALRTLMATFIGAALLSQPPHANVWLHWAVFAGYLAAVAVWSWRALRSAGHLGGGTQRSVALLMLCVDLLAVAIISTETGISSAETWTSDVVQHGLFLIPLIAAAQLDPVVIAWHFGEGTVVKAGFRIVPPQRDTVDRDTPRWWAMASIVSACT